MTETTFADVEIRVFDKRDGSYPVDITVNHEQEFPRGHLSTDLLPWVPSSPEEDGQRLFDWLFADEALKTAWAEVRGRYAQRRIRLRIDAQAPELHAIPWELLRDTGGEVAYNLAATSATPFSRYLAGTWRPGSPILKRPIKVLVAIANPAGLAERGLATIEAEREWASLQAATEGVNVELTRLTEPCTLTAIEAELREGYHVLHLIAHGAYDEDDHQAALYLAGGEDQLTVVTDAEFAEMLAQRLQDADVARDDKLRLVFLASCETATRSPADAFRGLAPKLVQAGVPAVLAMQDLVPMETARAFASTFYERLLAEGQVDLAANEARASLLTAKRPGAEIPVLFMRLRSGTLLGQRGRITSEREDLFWPFLLENIDLGRCLPFLGPRVTADLLPGRQTVAERLADKYGYPLADRTNLARVGQFIAINDPELLRSSYLRILQRSLFSYLDITPTKQQKRRFRNASFTETAEALDWAEAVLTVQENELHHMLADLELPLYVTTNADNFMAEALRHTGLDARRVGPRWQQTEAGTPQHVLSPPPSPDQPVVFHLNGHDGDPEQRQHLVLAEDDYLAHFVRLARDQESILPMNVLEALSRCSFLFLGYSIDDWEFRVILQGLLAPLAQVGSSQKMHVGVQLDVQENPNADKVIDYLRRYLGRFNIEIYWGTPQQFVTELHTRWQEYLEFDDDDW